MRNQLRTLDDRLRMNNNQFDKFPTKQNFYVMQDIWSQKVSIMQQICDVVNNIISSLTETTKIILTSLRSSMDVNNRLGILLNDSSLGFIYSLVEHNQYQLDINGMYRQSCLMQNIPSLLSNIEIKTQMMRLSLPNFDSLKRLIRGY
ncbi:MAG: hypothetical protein NC453_30780 [Muribaculum sp.]|nr:hypothetical protein [Muribaculum sp.]